MTAYTWYMMIRALHIVTRRKTTAHNSESTEYDGDDLLFNEEITAYNGICNPYNDGSTVYDSESTT